MPEIPREPPPSLRRALELGAATPVADPGPGGPTSTGPVTPPPFALGADLLADAASLAAPLSARWHPHVLEAAERFAFGSPARLAMWIAQCGHESGGFKRLVENLNYSADALRKTWAQRFPTDEVAQRYARQPERIANYVYADRIGNGSEASGDGWKYRGRGLIQITGRENYRACGAALGVDLEAEPDLLASDRWAALSAGWFWDVKKLGPPADAGNLELVTRRINGGLKGLEDRRERWERAKRALGA